MAHGIITSSAAPTQLPVPGDADKAPTSQNDARAVLLSGLLGYLFVAVWEELLMRGILFRLLERGLGTIAALVMSSLVFGLLHLGNPGATLVGALGTAVGAGVLLAAAYRVTRNLWLVIGIHWAADFWQGTVFGCTRQGRRSPRPSSRPPSPGRRCGQVTTTAAALSASSSVALRRSFCS